MISTEENNHNVSGVEARKTFTHRTSSEVFQDLKLNSKSKKKNRKKRKFGHHTHIDAHELGSNFLSEFHHRKVAKNDGTRYMRKKKFRKNKPKKFRKGHKDQKKDRRRKNAWKSKKNRWKNTQWESPTANSKPGNLKAAASKLIRNGLTFDAICKTDRNIAELGIEVTLKYTIKYNGKKGKILDYMSHGRVLVQLLGSEDILSISREDLLLADSTLAYGNFVNQEGCHHYEPYFFSETEYVSWPGDDQVYFPMSYYKNDDYWMDWCYYDEQMEDVRYWKMIQEDYWSKSARMVRRSQYIGLESSEEEWEKDLEFHYNKQYETCTCTYEHLLIPAEQYESFKNFWIPEVTILPGKYGIIVRTWSSKTESRHSDRVVGLETYNVVTIVEIKHVQEENRIRGRLDTTPESWISIQDTQTGKIFAQRIDTNDRANENICRYWSCSDSFSPIFATSLCEDFGTFLDSHYDLFGSHQTLEIVISFLEIKNHPGYYYILPKTSENQQGLKILDKGDILETLDQKTGKITQYPKGNLGICFVDSKQITESMRERPGFEYLQLQNSNQELLVYCDDQAYKHWSTSFV